MLKYLKLYNKTPKEMGKMLLDAVYQGTGLTATCGIGTNLFLAKVALDITAKKSSYWKQLIRHLDFT